MKPKALKTWREKNGYSQAALAKILGVHVMSISKWERGVREIPPYLHIALKCLVKENGGN